MAQRSVLPNRPRIAANPSRSVESLDELNVALKRGRHHDPASTISSLDMMREASRINAGRAILEAPPGNVTLETIAAVSPETGVDHIIVGALTKDIKAPDLSMRFVG